MIYTLIMDNSDTIFDFNNMVLELASQIAILCPTSIIANNIDILQQLIKKNPKSIIDIFVMYVLKYKPLIDSGDDEFFLNNTFERELSVVGNNINDNDLVKKAFEFKTIWKQLNQQNRDVVKQYMQFLCQLSLTYIS
jgi:hypothetical protein